MNTKKQQTSLLKQQKIAVLSRIKIKENVLTEHKFTYLLKSASPRMTMPYGKGNFDFFSIVDCGKVDFVHLQGKLTVLKKTPK